MQCCRWWKIVFDEPVKNNLRKYDIIKKTAIGQEKNYTTGCLLNYNYFNDYYKIITINLSKQKAPDVDRKNNTTK